MREWRHEKEPGVHLKKAAHLSNGWGPLHTYRKKYHEEQRAHRTTAYRDSLAMDTRDKQHAIVVEGLESRLPAWHENPDLRFLAGALAMALLVEVTVAR